jgi:hypothetical protein
MHGHDGPDGSAAPPRPPPRDGVFDPVVLSHDRPHLIRWGAIVVIALAIVIIKPWQLGTSEPGGPSAAGEVPPASLLPPASEPSARPALVDEIADDFCLDQGQWLATSIERWRGGTIRIWRALETSRTATGPTDPTIPVTPLVSEGVIELGWCAPTYGADRPEGAATIDAWRDGATAEPVTLAVDRRLGTTSRSGALYVPPRRPVSSRGLTWPPGRYVFRHHTDRGSDRWFVLEVLTSDAIPVS